MYDIFSKLNPLAFLIALIVGLVYNYITFPEPRIIVKHPTPNNAGKIIYKDNSENCFKLPNSPNSCRKIDRLVFSFDFAILVIDVERGIEPRSD